MKGKLIIIGGNEDKEGPCLILRKFLEMAGGKEARIVILTAASDAPLETGTLYQHVFKRLGGVNAELLDIPDRQAAGGREVADLIRRATGVFFTGGDQLRITSALGGTGLLSALEEQFSRGLVIAGTSAGASVMSSTMITEGESDESPQLNTVKMSPGFGLAPGMVIDQHFAQRGRTGRLLTALAQNPSVLGLGIDEDTAVIIDEKKLLVWGNQTVTILDGWEITHTNASTKKPEEFLALTRVIVHILPHGYNFDLEKRVPFYQKQAKSD